VLEHWQMDSDLESVRHAKALSALPTGEREAWARLWADVANVLENAKR
jgi:hypothetical protein